MTHFAYLIITILALVGLGLSWGWTSDWLINSRNTAFVNAATFAGTFLSFVSLGVTFLLAQSVASLRFETRKRRRLPEIAEDIEKYSNALKNYLNELPESKQSLDESMALLKSGIMNVSSYVPTGIRTSLEILKFKILLYQVTGWTFFAKDIHVHICEIRGRVSGHIADQEAEHRSWM